MPRYKDTYTREGIDFTVTNRQGNVCLLVGTYSHTPDHHTFEVHKLRWRKPHPKSADDGEVILSRPTESDWGSYGWTFITLGSAKAKFDELADEQGAGSPVKARGIRCGAP